MRWCSGAQTAGEETNPRAPRTLEKKQIEASKALALLGFLDLAFEVWWDKAHQNQVASRSAKAILKDERVKYSPSSKVARNCSSTHKEAVNYEPEIKVIAINALQASIPTRVSIYKKDSFFHKGIKSYSTLTPTEKTLFDSIPACIEAQLTIAPQGQDETNRDPSPRMEVPNCLLYTSPSPRDRG